MAEVNCRERCREGRRFAWCAASAVGWGRYGYGMGSDSTLDSTLDSRCGWDWDTVDGRLGFLRQCHARERLQCGSLRRRLASVQTASQGQ